MKAYILANGKGNRWNNYAGVEKPLIVIDGETLIERMVRLLKKNRVTDITIVGKYEIEGCTNYINKSEHKWDVFIELAELAQEPFIILNADCYYTENIIKDCVKYKPERWAHWTCPDKNVITGKPYGEGYIHKVTNLVWWTTKLNEFRDKIPTGEIDISAGNDWMINRYLYGYKDLYTHIKAPNDEYDIYWLDETDDFDFPEDYDRFLKMTGHKGNGKTRYERGII